MYDILNAKNKSKSQTITPEENHPHEVFKNAIIYHDKHTESIKLMNASATWIYSDEVWPQ